MKSWLALTARGMTAVIPMVFIASAVAQPFTRVNTPLPTTFPNGTAWADYDADGDMDLLVTDLVDTNTEESRLYRNTGGAFTRVDLPPVRHSYYGFSTFWDDANRDGRLDLLLTGSDEASRPVMRLLHGQSDGTFVDGQIRLEGEPLLWADLDNDGDLDVVASNPYAPGTCWLYWNQDETNYLKSEAVFGAYLRRLAAVDVDGDGDLDVMPYGQSGQPIPIFRNDGDGRFTDSGVRLPGYAAIAAAWVDVDGDGDLDLLGGGKGPNSIVVPKVRRNDGNFLFADANPELPTAVGGTIRWADFDQDGDADALINAAPETSSGLFDPRVRVFRGDGAFHFTDLNLPLPTFAGGGAEVADVDGDGDVDFLITGEEFSTSNPAYRRLYRNDHPAAGIAPGAPTSLSSAVSGGRVILRWARPAGRTTANLRVGTQPGAGDIIGPLAGPTGRRLVPTMGNAQGSTNGYLVGLKPGTYYWSVQAVDLSFRTSPFAEERSFTVEEPTPLPPPTISALSHQYVDEDASLAPLEFVIGPESALAGLNVSVRADNPALTPLSGILVSGTGTNRALTIVPAANQFGTSFVTVEVADPLGQLASTSFLLTVNAINDLPVLGPIPSQLMYEGTTATVDLPSSDVETANERLTITATSSNPALLPASGLLVMNGRFLANPELQVTPLTNRTGSATVTVRVSDGIDEATSAFVVTVMPRPFGATSDRLPVPESGQAAWADFDRDGDLDLLLTEGTTNRLYRNTGVGLLVDASSAVPGLAGHRAFVADYDRDGDVDVLLLGLESSWLVRNNGGTNLDLAGHVSGLRVGADVAWGDVDSDGDMDFVSSEGAVGLRVMLNQAGEFSVATSTLPRIGGYVALGDYDADGLLDFAFSGTTTTGVITNGILHGTGGGRFEPSGLSLDQTTYGPVGFCDVDADGLLDFWQVGFYTTQRRLFIYPGLAGGRFAEPVVIPSDLLDPTTARWADFDGDGDLDFLIEEGRGEAGRPPDRYIAIHRNEGDLQFTHLGDPLPDVEPRFLGIGDFDNDGDVDLSATMLASGPFGVGRDVRVLTNRVSLLNPPPGAPTALEARVEGDSVWLTWDPAADVNQRGGLTYNVRVGSRPGATDIVPAMSLDNGFRLVVGAGNAGVRRTFRLQGLVGETFYWSVQAVDNSYVGGPFAMEQRFVLNLPGNQPPVIGAIAEQSVQEDHTLSLPLELSDDRTPMEGLRLRAFAADPFLLPASRITFEGSGATRTLVLAPATNQTGRTTVTIEVTDAVGVPSSLSFFLIVSNENDPPWISGVPAQTHLYSAEALVVAFTIYDPDTPVDQLQFEAVAEHPDLVASTNLVLGGTGTNRTLTIRTARPVEGDTTITLTVRDSEGTAATTSFALSLRNQMLRLLDTPFGGVRNGSMAWGDYDNDGDLDLAIAGQGLNQTPLYRNEGEGRFVKADTDLPNVDGGGVEWGDFDNDGDLDLLIHGRGQPAGGLVAVIARNLGGGRFEVINPGLTGRYGPAAWGDFDNDGDLDIVSTGDAFDAQYRAVVYRNAGSATFAPVHTFNAIGNAQIGWSGVNHLWEDIDQDGYLDLVLMRFSGFQWMDAYYRADGQGGFADRPVPWTGSLVGWGDFDNDGRPEVVESTSTRGELRVARWTEEGAFQPWGASLLSPFTPDNVAAGDFDNDGRLDLFATGYEGNFHYITRLFRSLGGGQWQRVEVPLLDYLFGAASWADIDNDGDLDLLVNGQRDQAPMQGYTTLLYRNDQALSNAIPSAPAGLRASFTSDAVTLRWAASTDANQSGGLTYNVRIGTSPGGFDVLAPMAMADGHRLVPRPGNSGWVTWKRVAGLERGRTYYWTVQAVDHAYAGSPFAAEANFTLGAPPTLAVLDDVALDEDGVATVVLTITDPDGDVALASVTAIPGDAALVPESGLTVSGQAEERILTISPAADQFGTTAITVTVLDEQGGEASRTFQLTVRPVNDPPRAAQQMFTLEEDTSVGFTVAATDPDGDSVGFRPPLGPWHGELTGEGPEFVYVPHRDFNGADWCEIRLIDDLGAVGTARVSFAVTPRPDVPEVRLAVRVLADGTPLMILQGEPFLAYVIEESSDLRTWVPLGVYSSPDGRLEFVGDAAGSVASRFFRARER